MLTAPTTPWDRLATSPVSMVTNRLPAVLSASVKDVITDWPVTWSAPDMAGVLAGGASVTTDGKETSVRYTTVSTR